MGYLKATFLLVFWTPQSTNNRILMKILLSKAIYDEVSFKRHFFLQNFIGMFLIQIVLLSCASQTQSFSLFDSLNENQSERLLF